MLIRQSGGLAQLARAPALQAGGHRFDSDILHTRTDGVRSKKMAPWRIAQRFDAEKQRSSLNEIVLMHRSDAV